MSSISRRFATLSPARIGWVVLAVLGILFLARRVVTAGGFDVFTAVVIAAPFAFYLSLTAPLVFPFGAYIMLVPFDTILSVTSGATLARLVAIAAAAALVFRTIALRQILAPQRAWFWWLGFIAYVGLSLVWTTDVPNGNRTFGSILQLFLVMTVLALYPARKREFERMLAIVVASGAVAGSLALWQFVTGHMTEGADQRVSFASGNLVVDQNWFASSFLLPIGVATALATSARTPWMRAAYYLAIGVMMGGILLSGSRGGFMGVVMLFAYLIWRSRRRLQMLLVSGGALALSALFPVVWQRFFDDLTTGSGRTYIWKTGLHTLSQHWLFGTGIGSFSLVYDRSILDVFQKDFAGWDRPSHSLLVGSLTEYGVVGFIILMGAWYATFRQMRTIGPAHPYHPLRLGLESALIGLFIQSLFLDTVFIKYIWLANSLPLLVMNLLAPRALFAPRELTMPFGRVLPTGGRPLGGFGARVVNAHVEDASDVATDAGDVDAADVHATAAAAEAEPRAYSEP